MNSLSRIIVRHARATLVLVAVAVVLAGAWGIGVLDRLSVAGYSDTTSDAAQVDDTVQASFGRDVADVAIVYTPVDGRTVDDIGAEVQENLADLDARVLAREPVTYWSVPPEFRTSLRSFDGSSALAVLSLNGDEDERVKTFADIRDARSIDGVTVEFGGFSAIADSYNSQARSDLVRAELITFPILLVLLLVIFGSITAAAVPLCIGGLSIVASFAALRALTSFTEVSVFATNIASLVSLGMAIDYSLFVLTRFREELRSGATTEHAVRDTMRTAGRTVMFSAVLLVCGFLGMMIFPQAMIRSLGFGGIAAVSVAAFVSLTALPATLMIIGPAIDSLTWRRGSIERADLRAQTFWRSVADRVMRRPVLVVVGIGVFLALLSAPAHGSQLGDLDHTGLPADSPARVVTDRLFADFPLVNPGVTVLVRSTNGEAPSADALAAVTAAASRVEGINAAFAAGTTENYGVVKAVLTNPDRTTAALDTVDRLRRIQAPEGTDIRIGGATALSQDGIDAVYDSIPWMLLVMILATFVVTTAAFRSIMLSLKAIAMALISLGATFGVLTWIFVDGHGAGLLGVTPGPLPSAMTILVIAVVFGLSTDYEIFLLSRIVEAHDDGASTRESVRIGAGRTGRVVTAAALLLVTVTAAFSLSDLSMMRFAGVGIIVGLVIDASIVRMLLVPATVALMGKANWWLHPTPRDVGIAAPATAGARGRGEAEERSH